jgi:6-pyruvoyl-tetrahydropterin synthase
MSDRRTDPHHTWVLERTYDFEASHQLLRDPGRNALVHGHSWLVTVRVESHGLIRLGSRSMTVMREEALDAIVNPIIGLLDHRHLNDKLEDDQRSKPAWEHPTSEKVARWIANEVAVKLPSDVEVERVRVAKAGSAAEYMPRPRRLSTLWYYDALDVCRTRCCHRPEREWEAHGHDPTCPVRNMDPTDREGIDE